MRKNRLLCIFLSAACMAGLMMSGCGSDAAPDAGLSVSVDEQEPMPKDSVSGTDRFITGDLVDDPEHKYSISVIHAVPDETTLSPGDELSLWVDEVAVWTFDKMNDDGFAVYVDPVTYHDDEGLAAAGFYLVWCDYPGLNGDGTSPFGGLSTDESFSDDDGFAASVSFPESGNYWLQAALIDGDGNVYQTIYYDEIIVR